MSKRIKIIIFIITMTVCSTGYWLYQIDVQEQIVTNFSIQEAKWQDKKERTKNYDIDIEAEKVLDRETVREKNHEITSVEKVQAERKIKASYRYMITCDIVLIIVLIITSRVKI